MLAAIVLALAGVTPVSAQTYSYNALAPSTGWVRNGAVSCNFPNRADLRIGRDQSYDERVYFTFDLSAVVRPPNATLQSLQLVFTVASAPNGINADVWDMSAYTAATPCATRYSDAGSGTRFSLSSTSLSSNGTKWVTLNVAARTAFESAFGGQWTLGLAPTASTASLPYVEIAGPLAAAGRPYLHAVWTAGSAPGAFSLSAPQDGWPYATNTSTVTLQWNAATRADYYEVFVGEGASPPSANPIIVNSGTSTTYTVANGRAYAWTVKAKNIYGATTATNAPRRFSVAVQTGALDVTVMNVGPSPAPRPGAVCDLYGPAGAYVGQTVANSNGHCYWPGLPINTSYVMDVRYDGAVPAFPGPEYWLRTPSLTVPTSVTVTRNQPWATGIVFKKGDAFGQVIPTGGTLNAGDVLWAGVTVTQNTGATTSSRTRLLLDRDQTAPYDVECQPASPSQQVPSGGQTVFECSAPLTLPGNYYRSIQVETLSSTLGWTKTDSWAWGSVFTVLGQANRPPTLCVFDGLGQCTLTPVASRTLRAGSATQVVYTVNARDLDSNLTELRVSWNDGSAIEHIPISGGQSTVQLSHAFPVAAAVTWSATAHDDTGASSGPLFGTVSVYEVSGPRIQGFAHQPTSGVAFEDTPVFIDRLGGAPISALEPTWLVIHGRNNTSLTSEMYLIAGQLRHLRPTDQVLLLDWGPAALPLDDSDYTGERWIEPVGQWAATVLADFGFAGDQLRLVGHSWGSYVAYHLSESIDRGSGPSAQVSAIVALDPAHDVSPLGDWFGFAGTTYDPEARVNFAAHSRFSWAIKSSLAGSPSTPATADESFVLNFDNLVQRDSATITAAHGLVRKWFVEAISNNGPVGRYFSLDRLVSSQPGPWDGDWYDQDGLDLWGIPGGKLPLGYEGTVRASSTGIPTAEPPRFHWGPSPFLIVTTSSGTAAVTGQPYRIDFEVEDGQADLSRIGVDWHDGTPIEYIAVNGGLANVSFSRSFNGLQSPQQWSAIAEDALGNMSNRVDGAFDVTVSDLSSPSVTVLSHASGQVIAAGSITLSGTASDLYRGDNGIQRVTVNGIQASGTATGGGTANWLMSVPLSVGSNTITVIAYDDSPNHNASVTFLTVTRELVDSTSPSVSLTSHFDGQVVTTSSVTVSGFASDAGWGDSGIQQVTVNGLQASGGNSTGSASASWNAVVTLVPGVNVLTALASDDSPNHNQATATRTVVYQPQDSTSPRLSIASPTNGDVVSTQSLVISGTASDAGRGDSGIQQVTVNGTRASNDTAYGSGSTAWSATVPLVVGTNQLTVIAADDSAAHNARTTTLTITYQPSDVATPWLQITSHADGQIVMSSSITLIGTASDSGFGDNGIQQVTVNGAQAANAAAVGGATATWSAVVPLQVGLNFLDVVATDDSPAHNSSTITLLLIRADTTGCSYVLNPTDSGLLSGAGTSGTFGVTTTAGCGWSAVPSDPSWIRIDTPAQAFSADWAQSAPSGTAPSARNQVASQYDAATDRLIVMGGNNYGTLLNDVWVLTNATQPGGAAAWTPLAPQGTLPAIRQAHVSGYDPATNRLVVHGGWPGLKDTWVLTHANGLGGQSQWVQLPDAPLDRAGGMAAYDVASNRLIVFGGLDVNYYTTEGWYNDVWVLRDANGVGTPKWEQLQPGGAPPPARYYGTTAYDPTTNRLIVFGGGGQTGLLNDLWVLTNANGLGGQPQWLQFQAPGPNPRSGHHLAYDPFTKRAWLVAGEEDAGARPSDAWVLDHADGSGAPPAWTPATLSGGGFGGNSVAAFGFAPATGRAVLALGVIGGQYRQDVWAASLTTAATSSGSGTIAFTLAPNSGTAPRSGSITVAGQTYAISQEALGCSYVLNPPDSGLLSGAGTSGTFGVSTTSGCGWNAVPSDPSWIRIDAPAQTLSADWAQSAPTGAAPSARNQVASQYDAADDRLIVMGGNNYATLLNDVWVLANATQPGGTAAWTPLSPQGTRPAVRQAHMSGYDPVTNRLIVHGGWPGLKDTWVLTNANGLGGPGQWIRLPDAPLDRAGGMAAYDAASNRLILFGGLDVNYYTTQGWYNDVWVLRDANGVGTPTWEQLQPAGPRPPARYYGGSAYDPTTNRLIVVGGAGQTGLLNDLWVLTNANGLGGQPQWLQYQAPGPNARSGQQLGYDPFTKRAWLVGGEENGGVRPSDVWVLEHADGSGAAPAWTQASTSGGNFGGNSVPAFGFAPAIGRVVLALGVVGGQYRQDVWTANVAAATASSGSGTVAFTVAPNPGTGPRSGSIIVAGQTYTISQAGFTCGYTINPATTGMVAASGASSYFYLYTSQGCAWNAVSDAPWVTVTSSLSGTGTATISYTVGANQSSLSRAAHITVGGESFSVFQAGATCSFSISASPGTFSANGGSGLATIAAAPSDCDWSASVDVPWITLNQTSGSGSTNVAFDVSANPSTTARNGHLLVAGQSIPLTQAGKLLVLTVTKVGSGSGTITSVPPGIDCGVACTAAFAAGQQVALSHTASQGSSFEQWTGDADCSDGVVDMVADTQCIAHFAIDIVGDPVPSITHVSPTSVPPAASGLTLSVSGTNFHPNSVVRWNGVDHVPTSITATLVVAQIGANELVTGTAVVTIRTPGGAVSNDAFVQVATPSSGLQFAASTTGAGAEPVGVAAGDLNADGKPDLVSANIAASTVSVLLGNGDGTFGQRTDFATGIGPSSVLIADVNRDGRSDVLTTDFVANTVSVAIGNGDGSLSAPMHFPVGLGPFAAATADVDADGAVDLLVANSGSMSFSVLLGYGDGTFGPALHHATSGSPQGIVAADFDGNGIADVATADATGTLSVCPAAGNGVFAACAAFAGGSGLRGLVAGDIDGDGNLDVATANEFGDSVSTWLGDGAGGLGPRLDVAVGTAPRALAIGDLNADAALDLIAVNSGSGTVSVLFGNGDGTFQPRRDFTSGAGPVSTVTVDVDRDGRLDLAVANQPANALSVLAGRLPAAVSVPPSTDFGQRGIGAPAPTRAIAVTNVGGVPLNVSSVSLASGAVSEFSLVSETCTSSPVPPHGSCAINVRYLATTGGLQSATLVVASDATGAPHATSLLGEAVPPATVAGFSPASGPAGATVTISGTSLSGTTAVSFNGSVATFSIVDQTTVTAVVPGGAVSGPIAVVTVLNDVTTTASFQIAPRIDAWSVSNGPVGTVLTLSGANFLPSGNAVKFGQGYVKNVDSPDGTTLVVVVPDGLDLCAPSSSGLCPAAFQRVRPGDYPLLVISGQEVSNSFVFTVTP